MNLALFDLDHTLLPIDSDHAWGKLTISIGWRDAVEFGRIIIDAVPKKTSLVAFLANFDPQSHDGEAMAFAPLGKEVMS